MSEVVFHRLDHPAVLRALRAYTERTLAPRAEVRQVILIGSLSRDDWSARSDADIVVIVDRCDERGPLRGPSYAPREPVGVPVDVLVFTAEEAAAWSPRFRAEVDAGIVLHLASPK